MELKDVKSIYFIGIGGIGMSALARYFQSRGVRVAGYDRTETPLCRELAAEGMQIRYAEEVASLPEVDLVVYTPAIPATHKELVHFQQTGTPLYKRSEVLGLISRGMRTIAIGGTHGKTTTTTLTTYLLRACGIDVNAFLGGISRNFATNYVNGKSDWVVIEADEYDRSFLRLDPDIAVIMAMDADHLEIYGDHAQMVETGFRAFARKVKTGGSLLLRHDLLHFFEGVEEVTGIQTFGIEQGMHHSDALRVDEEGFFVFDYHSPLANIPGLRHPHPGRHNVENATVAITIALLLGASPESIRVALPGFKGIARRFELIAQTPATVYVDDYAHHPVELAAAIDAARQRYRGRRITVVFQPHLFTRTRDLAVEFARALDQADEVLLMEIYPARELPIPGVSADTIRQYMDNRNCRILGRAEVLETIERLRPEVLLTLGAGDIDTLVEPIKALIEQPVNTH
jgi:UDP-N-acetylmuramate--alanine ligase